MPVPSIALAHMAISRHACLCARFIGAAVAGLVVAGLPTVAWAGGADTPQKTTAGTPYAVARWIVAGGGGRSSGGTFAISGTIGQPDSDPLQPATGGSYAITGGFWPGVRQATPGTTLFADGFEVPSGSSIAMPAFSGKHP